MTYTESKQRKVYNIDLDHTLTADPPGIYTEDPLPNIEIIEALNKKYMTGNIIIIWTARWWDNAPFVVSWLIKHGVKFHGIMMGKGGSDCYVDDKAIQLSEFMEG